MQLIKIIQARAALCRLTETRFKNFTVARNLCALRKKVEELAEFTQQEQGKAVQAHAVLENGRPVLSDGGNIRLKSAEDKAAYDAEMQELVETEISDINPVTIVEADFRSPEDYPSPDDMMALDGLVEFKEG